ncbi:MAG: PBP1A family penicillin-binding protein [Mollicutes bacterium]|nr:PBP1A family penicillin-binding protein [Mollicutes bacterium]MDY5875848.1 PBP1A family penicillin-binding protein [Bacilli bacterium]
MKKLFKFFCFLFIIFVITIIGCFLYVKLSPKVTINSANNISLYDTNKTIYFKGNESKEWVDLDDISDYLIKSTIYTEDKNFYKHFGFDFLRIGKAILTNITSHSTNQGASTITQQYAKNLFLDFDKTWKRKWDEMWYTMRIEANYSKDEILEGYLNTINYGHGKYGIENASKFYFNKSSKDLDLAEASMLSGIPKAPSIYSPIINFENAKKRQLIVLNALVSNGIISSSEKDEAYSEELTITANSDKENLTSINYYIDAVMNELESIDSIPRNYIDYNGLKIYTNFNYDIQSSLEENVKNTFPDDSKIETSSVVMNPENGGIMALIGGKDYNNSTYNRAISSKRQVGSTMKPYLYYAALENGFTSSTAFTSEKTTFPLENGKTYSPVNYNDKYGNKAISMATAIAYSDNIYAVKTHMFLGYDALINVARRVGIKSKLESVPSLPLGTNEINIIEMAQGYAAFANEGYKVEGHFIEKIENGKGEVLYEYKKNKELVLNSSLVYILNNMLTATYDPLYVDYNYPTGIGLNGKLTHTYALKSGTTNGDNWNIGFNKKIVCAVWVGYDNNKELSKKDYKYAQNIWYKTVESYEKNMKDEDVWYEKPKNVVGMLVEPISGKPATESEKKQKLMYFLKGTEPKETDTTFDEITSN